MLFYHGRQKIRPIEGNVIESRYIGKVTEMLGSVNLSTRKKKIE